MLNRRFNYNVAIPKPKASREEVIEACKKIRYHDFIMRMPDEYDTVLAEVAIPFQGERQRISIARFILKDTLIILLDEATASVGMDNERYIEEAINELCRNKTIIVIAHRIYTVKDADQILVLKDGVIAEQGKYDELIRMGGAFGTLAAAGVRNEDYHER